MRIGGHESLAKAKWWSSIPMLFFTYQLVVPTTYLKELVWGSTSRQLTNETYRGTWARLPMILLFSEMLKFFQFLSEIWFSEGNERI